MADLKVNVGDETAIQDAPGGVPVPGIEDRKSYQVVAEGGLFKNGKTYKKGERVELADETAQAAIAAGDIKEIK